MFQDRFEAGRMLAERLEHYRGLDCVVLAIPRGGLQIGYVIARELEAPLDIVLTKKIGYPGNSEYAIGAVSLKGRILSGSVDVPESYIESETGRIREHLKRMYALYRDNEEPIAVKGKTAIIVDDGIATGSTMLATVNLVRSEAPSKIVVAVPVGPQSSVDLLKKHADEVVCLEMPAEFYAIGEFYENFEQVEDDDAISLLREANKWEKKANQQ